MTIPQTASVVLPAGRLTASAVDVARRTIEGILVPWDEVGQPAINGEGRRVRVRRGALALAAAVPGIDTHDRPTRPVSALVAHEVRDAGIWGRLAVDPTPAGDQLLADVAAGKRLGLSVEASGLMVDPAVDEVIGGTVDCVAHVDQPAFPSARVHSMAAALCTTPTTTGEAPPVTAPTTTTAPAADAAPAIDYGQLAAALAPALAAQMTAAAVPGGLPTASLPSPGLAPSAGPAPDTENPIVQAATMQAEVFRTNGGTSELRAALADITNSGLDLFQNPSVLGEKLWEGAADTSRPFVDMMDTSLPLTSWKGTGWEWVNRPKVEAYPGDKAPIPTNTVSVRSIEWEADRVAGGWDIDRKFRDFGDAEFWTEFYSAQVESYREVTNDQAATALISYALDITVDANVPAAFQGINVAQADVLRAAALGTAILRRMPRVKSAPDYVIMNTADWLSLVDITNLDLPAFLAMLKVDPGKFDHHPEVPAGSIILGVKKAARFRELGGGSPIRVEALDVARGGVDSAVFGYTARYMTRSGGIIRVPLTTGA